MSATKDSQTCLVLKVGVVGRGSRCLAVMSTLHNIRNSRMNMRLVAICPIENSTACYKYAGETGIEIFDDYRDLAVLEYLDIILELTGSEEILSDIIRLKRRTAGVLDRSASLLLFEMAKLYSGSDVHHSEITLARSFASALLEASPDAVLVIDHDHQIINCNKSPLISGSYDCDDVIGRNCFDVMRCNGPEGCPIEDTKRTGRTARAIQEVITPEDSLQIRQITTYPIFDAFGEIAQFIVTIRDMTKDLGDRVEERARALKKNLAHAVQDDRLTSLGRLVASVCHEINNPLTSIVTFTKLIRSMLQSELSIEKLEAIEKYLDLSFHEGMRCGAIVKNLLTFARPKSMEPRDIDIHDMLNTILLLTSHQLEMTGVRCEVDLPPSPFTAWGGFAQIQQVLLNLIFNAIDAMPQGGVITISGGIEADTDFIWLAVSDTGHGIEARHLQRVFEPFYSTKTDGKGVGLGLSMVYGIIREHKGAVEVESEPGKGTTFRIKLPRTLEQSRGGAEGRFSI